MEQDFNWPERPDFKIRNKEQKLKSSKQAKSSKLIVKNAKSRIAVGLAASAALAAAAGLVRVSGESRNNDTDRVDNKITLKVETDSGVEAAGSLKSIENELILETFKGLKREDIDKAGLLVDQMVEIIKKNPSYNEMKYIVNKYSEKIKREARMHSFPEDLALGIVFVENGGGEDLVSPAGAVGVAQFLPETAVEYGLRVDAEVDERKNPEKSIEAMVRKLANDRKLFAYRADFAVWAYHAGLGNVFEALRLYYYDKTNVDFGNISELSDEKANNLVKKYNHLIKEDNLSVHQLFENQRVRNELLVKLEDESELYPYKVIAAAAIFKFDQAFLIPPEHHSP